MNCKVMLGALGLSLSVGASAGPVFSSASYNASTTFKDGAFGTTMGLAFDGTNYYSANGGGRTSPLVKYDASGNVLGSLSPTPGIDFRSIFTNSSNELFARGCCDSSGGKTIYKQDATFGNFTAYVTLQGPAPDFQSAVVLDSSGTEYISRTDTDVRRWDLNGNALSSVTLNNAGVANAGGYPFDRGIAAAGGYWLTFVNQTLYAWDVTGALVDSTSLAGSGTTFHSGFSYSFANDMFWVVDTANGTWRGYDVGLTNDNGNAVPLPGTLPLALLGLVAVASVRRRKAA